MLNLDETFREREICYKSDPNKRWLKDYTRNFEYLLGNCVARLILNVKH